MQRKQFLKALALSPLALLLPKPKSPEDPSLQEKYDRLKRRHEAAVAVIEDDYRIIKGHRIRVKATSVVIPGLDCPEPEAWIPLLIGRRNYMIIERDGPHIEVEFDHANEMKDMIYRLYKDHRIVAHLMPGETHDGNYWMMYAEKV